VANFGNLATRPRVRLNQLSQTALTGLSIWDGQQRLDADCITFSGQKITGLCSGDELPPGIQRVSCDGATALPGLMDAHVHMELNPEHREPPKQTDLKQMPQMLERAAAMVRAGITTARDLGGGAWIELALRDRINSGDVPGPRLLCAGQPITSPQGHCHFWGGEAADIGAAKAVLKRQVEHGVDLIKVMATGGRMTRGSTPLAPQFDLSTLATIVATANSHHLRVAAHCHGTAGIEMAAQAGVTTIEHCSWVGPQGWASDFQPEVAELILNQGAFVSPTVNRGWQRMLDNKDQTLVMRLRAAYRNMWELGVPFVASTDAGIPGVFHHHLPEALNVFAKIAELTQAQTLQTATSGAARALGIHHITGQLSAGYDADILLVDGDPLADLAALTRPVGVWARGVPALMP
jgi:imidazolonepropionase-like amidohydrolase